jgi:hypothetical protein
MRSLVPWLVTVVAVVAMCISWHEQSERKNQIATLVEARAITERGGILAERRLHEIEGELAQSRLNAKPAEVLATNSNNHGAPIARDDLRKDPKYAAVWRWKQMGMVQSEYGEAIAALKLPLDKQARVRELLFERQEALLDAREVAHDAGLDGKASGEAMERAASEVAAELRQLIGDTGWDLLQQTAQLNGMKQMIATGPALDLQIAGVALTEAQSIALAQAYSNAYHSPVRGDGQPSDPSQLNPANQAIYAAAASFLSPAQLDALKPSLLNRQLMNGHFNQ